jgi:hypothetical protein
MMLKIISHQELNEKASFRIQLVHLVGNLLWLDMDVGRLWELPLVTSCFGGPRDALSGLNNHSRQRNGRKMNRIEEEEESSSRWNKW